MKLIRELKAFVTHVPAPIPSVFDGTVADITRPDKTDFMLPFQTVIVGEWQVNIPQDAPVRLGTEIRVVRGEKVRIDGQWYPVVNQIVPGTLMAHAHKVFPVLGILGMLMYITTLLLMLRSIGLFFVAITSRGDGWQDFNASVLWVVGMGILGVLFMALDYAGVPEHGIRKLKH